jgi:hypothetical protein
MNMKIMSARKSAEEKAVAANNIEGELQSLVRELGGQRRAESEPSPNVSDQRNDQPESGADVITRQANTLVQRVSLTSLKEIDKLISELQNLRNLLDAESQRVQQEISGYAHLSDTALKSARVIADNLAQWKRDAS